MRQWFRRVALHGLVAAALLPAQAFADLSAGVKAIERRDFEAAVRELSPLARQGDAEAQYHLGTLYANGEGVPQSYDAAGALFQAAAARGQGRARAALEFLTAIGALKGSPVAAPAAGPSASPGAPPVTPSASAPVAPPLRPGAGAVQSPGPSPSAPAAVAAATAPLPAAPAPAPAQAAAPGQAALPTSAPAPAVAGTDWRLQLATVASEEAGQAEARRVTRRFQAHLAGITVAAEKYQMADGSTVYRVLSQPLADASAREACDRIKAENGSCLLVRP